MNVEDWSTRKLKRRLFKAYRKVWYNQLYDLSGIQDRKSLFDIIDELKRRKWTV